ncbi:MAG TPA: thioesterase family protein, partial [Actinomycetota bacterium]|nr:thioesterase family protein [Actinomycetota bacterium]
LRNLEVRFGEGDFPMSGAEHAVGGGYVRNLGPARGPAALMTHMDAWPPPVLALVDRPVAASSVRWHVQFHADVDSAQGRQWSWFRCEAPWRSGSLSTVTGMLVREGVPVAYSEQTVVMYA